MRMAEPGGDFPQFAGVTRNRFLRRELPKNGRKAIRLGLKWEHADTGIASGMSALGV
jgi:hypothetical protein